ncbi:4Fe-4S dicluster domain-containing protein [Paraeggerthella hongkongensis]|uniref:4Fe-4S dicluster domain-containing protein n=1 Tax=Paraeggerthella hominis TaxID=2897351 RepID=UPI001C1140B7|nr:MULTISPECIES: 4Fe-4S dicluster domain-containing protein [Paraeggerthella]MBU5405946.1 4Fe-4S dicluster domain-containing protein [Paraeggerthella hongkongensis]MCD2433794.1 4Fe-4S dicluster domain-containing protein [Paraeggerthella hominis]
MASQMGFLLDQKWCIGCQACVTACQMRHRCPDDIQIRLATSFEHQPKGPWISVSCNHCENPACVPVCPVGALTKREDGIVVQDHDLCIGCQSCVKACPYNHPKYVVEENKTLRCDMCAARLDAKDVPACVEACPVKILTVDTLEKNEAAGGVEEGVGFTVEATKPTTRFIPIS